MKASNILIFFVVLCFQITTNAQWCMELPTNVADIEECNNYIAKKFAPELVQWQSICFDNGESGNADRITKVNFDNDWVATNNWQSLEDFLGDNSGWDNRPFCYYAVTWTPEVWIIVYSYYYARDYANGGSGCGEDEHEGDLARVFVVVKRPLSQDDDPEDLLVGFMTGEDDKEPCISTEVNGGNTYIPSSQSTQIASGSHPRIWSAAGSHHYYTDANRAFEDERSNVFGASHCRPAITSLMAYYPAATNNDISSNLTEIPILPVSNCDFPCSPSFWWDVPTILYCSNNQEYYGLIDIFDLDEGLWAQRNRSTLFGGSSYSTQHFLCDDGGGCEDEGWFDIVSYKDPHAPWEGTQGLSPLEQVFNGFQTFNCDCNQNDLNIDNCEDNFTIIECLYEYNPYLCEFYEIVMPEQFQHNGNWVNNPLETGGDVIIKFRFSALGVPINADVTWCWELPVGFNNAVSCIGCSQTPVDNCVKNGSDIILKIENASFEDLMNDPEQFIVTTTANLIECGEVSDTKPLDVQLQGLVSTDTANCEKMVFEIKEAWHIDGNVYDWDFPLYDALASVSNGGRRVEFNTESVIQQTSPTTNPEKKLEYSLTVTNPSYTSEIEVNGEREIPDCRYGGLGLMVYPNPATNDIYLEFEGVQQDEPLDIQIFDHQFNRVGRESYFLKGQNIDVSGLGNGLYFLCAVTNEGKMLTSKFCVGRH
jgi:hypothetical protein